MGRIAMAPWRIPAGEGAGLAGSCACLVRMSGILVRRSCRGPQGVIAQRIMAEGVMVFPPVFSRGQGIVDPGVVQVGQPLH